MHAYKKVGFALLAAAVSGAVHASQVVPVELSVPAPGGAAAAAASLSVGACVTGGGVLLQGLPSGFSSVGAAPTAVASLAPAALPVQAAPAPLPAAAALVPLPPFASHLEPLVTPRISNAVATASPETIVHPASAGWESGDSRIAADRSAWDGAAAAAQEQSPPVLGPAAASSPVEAPSALQLPRQELRFKHPLDRNLPISLKAFFRYDAPLTLLAVPYLAFSGQPALPQVAIVATIGSAGAFWLSRVYWYPFYLTPDRQRRFIARFRRVRAGVLAGAAVIATAGIAAHLGLLPKPAFLDPQFKWWALAGAEVVNHWIFQLVPYNFRDWRRPWRRDWWGGTIGRHLRRLEQRLPAPSNSSRSLSK